MGGERGNAGNLRASSYRVMVLVVVTGCHLALLMLVLRPVISRQDVAPIVEDNFSALKLRFIRTPHPSSQRLPAPTRHPITQAKHAPLPARSSKPLAAGQATHGDRQPRGTRSLHETPITTSPGPGPREGGREDGGFLERLHKAQRSHSIHGVPGSDTAVIRGIHLADPMTQGIGAVMRTAQRGLGIKSSHCIAVDVWRHLTPEELSARHISPDDVDRADEKYRCNDPPGLHF